MNESPPIVASRQTERMAVLLRRLGQWLVIATAFLVPIAALPVTDDPRLIKTILVEAAAVLLATLWLALVFIEKRIGYHRGPVAVGLGLLAAALVASAIFSVDRASSLWGADATGETLGFLLASSVLAWVASLLFSAAPFALRWLLTSLLASFGALAAIFLGTVAGQALGIVPAAFSGNPVGTASALAAVLAVGFLLALGLFFGRDADGAPFGKPLRVLAAAVLALAAAALFLLNVRGAWIGVGAVSVMYLAFAAARTFRRNGTSDGAIPLGALAVALAATVAAVFFTVRPIPLERLYRAPTQITPSFRATMAIAGRILGEGRVLGSGPATFLLDYNRYRDPAVNRTAFWTVRFTHGSSLAPTLLATIGILGALAFLGFLALTLAAGGRLILDPAASPMAWAAFGVIAALAFFSFSAGSTAASQFLLFLAAGIVGALFAARAAAGGEPGRLSAPARPKFIPPRAERLWRRWHALSTAPAGAREIKTPAEYFLVSLITAAAAAFSLVALYGLGAAYAAEVFYRSGVRAFAEGNDLDRAEAAISRARALNAAEDRYDRALAEAALARLRSIIPLTLQNPTPERLEQFRSVLSAGAAASERAGARHPRDPENWIVRGQLYEAVLPFLAGADQASRDAYRRAREADPVDPSLPFAEARAILGATDLVTLRINQTASGDERSRLEAERARLWSEARGALLSSLSLKPDYASAHFLLAQIAIREGNLTEAIRKSEETARLAPADVGVAFQLGILYYQAGDLDRAKAEFERAVLFNENYSNARYFLGLIWDRKGDADAALSQFQKIAQVNPDNEEVRRITQNLKAGRRALAGIAPPLPAPEARREAPVRESR